MLGAYRSERAERLKAETLKPQVWLFSSKKKETSSCTFLVVALQPRAKQIPAKFGWRADPKLNEIREKREISNFETNFGRVHDA